MSEKYKIFVEQEGINHVKVLKSEGNGFVNFWNFPLKGDDEPIIFKEFYTDSRFAIINWDGWIRLFDANIQTTLVDHKLNGKINSRAVFSLDKSKLYVTYTDDSSNHHLAILNLNNYEIDTLTLPNIHQKLMEIRKDGCLLFYKHDWETIEDKKVFKHFYSVLNLDDLKINQFELAFAPQFSFGEFKPVIDIENNRAILPVYDDVPHKTNASGEIVFEYRIALFDLDTFDITHVLSVRDFPKNQLGYYESDGEEMAELFLGTDRNKEYTNIQRDFFENLTSIKVVKDGMWLCWRGGIIRKIDSDFNLSPLLVTDSLPNNTIKGMFKHAYFDSHLYHIDDTTIVLAAAKDLYKTSIPTFDTANIVTPIPLPLERTSLDELYNLTYSKENLKEIKLRDSIQITVTDLSTEAGIIDALTQLETIVTDLKAAGIGHTLLLIFNDTKETTLQEPEFFAKAAAIAPERIQAILEKAMAHNSIRFIYRNEEESVLCHAVAELAKNGAAYVDTIIKYLNAIDEPDYDEFVRENIIQYLEKTYSVEVMKKKTKAFSPELGEWYELYREEYDED